MKNNQCPNCGQYKMAPRWTRGVLTGIITFVIGIFTSVILIGLLLMPIGLVIIAVSALTIKGMKCDNCGYLT